LDAAGATAAAPSNRGENLSAAAGATASTLDDDRTERGAASVGPRPSGRADGAPLDLHEGISDPAEGGCLRWPEHLALLNHTTGQLVRGRCRASNLCAYCGRLAAVENSEALALDALRGNAPTLWLVLTTREADRNPRAFYRSREQLQRALQRRWPGVEYAALVEFTTGYGPRSGGKQRPHWNVLLKGVPIEAASEVRSVVDEVWCRRVDAEPWAQHVGVIEDAGGLMRYIALHFQKEAQAPPSGWRGHRFVKSRGYFDRQMPVVREEARRSLRIGRLVWSGLSLSEALVEVDAQSLQAWSLERTHRLPVDRERAEREARVWKARQPVRVSRLG